MEPLVILAGATGSLGGQIAARLVERGAAVRALVRDAKDVAGLRDRGIEAVVVDFDRVPELAEACAGGSVVVSALSGLRDVIVGVQTRLLDAAVLAGVPRFIPSDFCLDYTRTPPGANRNLDDRRAFRARLDAAPVRPTSVLNGMFADLLVGPAPVVVFPLHRVVYWGDADQPLDFTTIANTAAYTTHVALDPDTPRDLRIAGDVRSARGLAEAATAATGEPFALFRAGGIARLSALTGLVRAVAPGRDALFPPWQGMQYLRDMFSGRGKLEPLDTDRYPEMTWTPVRDVLSARGGA